MARLRINQSADPDEASGRPWGARKASVVALASLALALPVTAFSSVSDSTAQAATTTQSVTDPSAHQSAPKPVDPLVPVDTAGKSIGAITRVSANKNVVNLKAKHGAARITFLDDTGFRLEADPSGKFTDPANTSQDDPKRSANIVVGKSDFAGVTPTVKDGNTITIKTKKVQLKVNKATSAMTLLNSAGKIIWTESQPITFGADSTTQHLTTQPNEQFIGTGMQNGRSVHTGATVNVASNFDWDDDGYPNAVPFYMSSNGYGVLRDTFAPGTYTFTHDLTATHQEKRFDAYYFVSGFKGVLDSYTKLTGRPLMPPVYALEYGDSDCYNRSNPDYSSSGSSYNADIKQRTPQAAITAKAFKDNDMPAGWMLVNDGYGCSYKNLPKAVTNIAKSANLETGLWTQSDLSNQKYEVQDAGVRLRKLDVAWVGEGYRMALTACNTAHDGIEQYSDARGTALMVEGWAGAQRCGMQWTGDHSGSLDAIRWQISALTGSGNSGLAYSTGDVDGIFGGSMQSYVRDLQWKAFAPALYSMSGWAPVDKRPWLYGAEATKINRSYLDLRQQLMPFIYTLADQAHNTGVSMMRSLPLEYPNDPMSYSDEANTEFLLGQDYLVAPVYTDSNVRNGIYLPQGQWVDYWSGQVYTGGQIVNGYPAPLDKLPLFVRAGALVPQGIVARNASLVPANSPITLQIYPKGKSSFSLYEDDQVTRAYENGASATQPYTVSAPTKGAGDVTVTIGKRTGSYNGMAKARPYALAVHSGSAPSKVISGGVILKRYANADAFAKATQGWYYDANNAGGTVQVKLQSQGNNKTSTITLKNTSAIGGKDSEGKAAQVTVGLDKQVFQGDQTTVQATFTNNGTKPKFDVSMAVQLPKGWKVVSSKNASLAKVGAGKSATASFVVKATANAAAGQQTITANVGYRDSGGTAQAVTGANQIYVAYGALSGAFDTVAVTDEANKAVGNFDGGGDAFALDHLLSADGKTQLTSGSKVTVGTGDDQITYTLPTLDPAKPNAMSFNGQTVSLSGSGTELAFLGSAGAAAGVTPSVTITYTDGTVDTQSFFYPNWLIQGTKGSAVSAAYSDGRISKTNGYEYAGSKYQLYSNTVRLLPGKQLKAVTFPVQTAVKIFDMQVLNKPLPAPPTGTQYVSDLQWLSATNGYGVIGKDVANKDTATSPDLPLIINTDPADQKTYPKGLGVHAPSKISYYLGGNCTSFTSDAGLEKNFGGTVIFKVNVDGQQKYQGATFKAGFPTEHISVDLTGASYLDLIVDPTDPSNINGAHGVWGGAQLTCKS